MNPEWASPRQWWELGLKKHFLLLSTLKFHWLAVVVFWFSKHIFCFGSNHDRQDNCTALSRNDARELGCMYTACVNSHVFMTLGINNFANVVKKMCIQANCPLQNSSFCGTRKRKSSHHIAFNTFPGRQGPDVWCAILLLISIIGYLMGATRETRQHCDKSTAMNGRLEKSDPRVQNYFFICHLPAPI